MQGLEKGPGLRLDWGNQKNHKLLEVVHDMGLGLFERLEDGGRMPNPGEEAVVREGCLQEVTP